MPVALFDDPSVAFDDTGVGFDGSYTVAPPVTAVQYARTYPDAAASFVYTLLDADLNEAGELHPVDDGQIQTTVQGNLNRKLTLNLLPADATIDPRTARIRPAWVDDDGVVWPLGVFRIIDIAVTDFSGGDRIEVTCGDESAAHHTPITRSLTWPRDFEVADIIDQLAGLLSVQVDADATTASLGEPLAFPLGSTDWHDVYSTVAAAAGMLPPYFTVDGLWRWRHVPDWEQQPPDHLLTDAIQASLVRTVTLLDTPNVWIAWNPSAKAGQIVGRYQLPASAPNSVERTDVEFIETIENAGLGTQTAADAAARAAAAGSLDDVGGAQCNIPIDPTIDLYDSIESDGLLYRVGGTTLNLTSGQPQTLNLRRIFRVTDPEGVLFAGTL